MRRKLLLFTAQFLPLLAIGAWLYPRVLPSYERLVLAVANPSLRRAAPPIEVAAAADGALEAYALTPGGRQPLYERHYRPDGIFLSLILFPALMVATPLPLRRRLLALAIGQVLIFALHAVSIVGLFRTYLCLKSDPGDFLCSWIKGFVLTSGQVGAVIGWAFLTWDYWLEGIRFRVPAGAAGTPRRNQPCPCGSGRKYKHCCAAG